MLTWSILLYAFSALAAGFSTSPEMLLFFRCTTFVGVCVEFVAAVAWLAELFPDPAPAREGARLDAGVLVGRRPDGDGRLLPRRAPTPTSLPAIRGGHAAWRYTLDVGRDPRAARSSSSGRSCPSRRRGSEKKQAGTLKRPSLGAMFQPELRRTTIVTTLMFACSYGAAFGAIQQMPRIVPGLAEVAGPARGPRSRRS